MRKNISAQISDTEKLLTKLNNINELKNNIKLTEK